MLWQHLGLPAAVLHWGEDVGGLSWPRGVTAPDQAVALAEKQFQPEKRYAILHLFSNHIKQSLEFEGVFLRSDPATYGLTLLNWCTCRKQLASESA